MKEREVFGLGLVIIVLMLLMVFLFGWMADTRPAEFCQRNGYSSGRTYGSTGWCQGIINGTYQQRDWIIFNETIYWDDTK